ncbi:cell division inhibitor [Klebsiella michiganensis]|nr:cell division inhibitor [Klebsiella michiganensis]
MNVLLTGGTGLIGRHLIPRLLELGHHVTVSTRSPEKAKSRLDSRVTLWRDFEHQANLNGIDAVINLAGEPIADKRWTAEQKTASLPQPLGYHPKAGHAVQRQRYAALGAD